MIFTIFCHNSNQAATVCYTLHITCRPSVPLSPQQQDCNIDNYTNAFSFSDQSPAEMGGESSHPIQSLIKLATSSFWLLWTLRSHTCSIHSVYYYSIRMIDNGSNYSAGTMAVMPAVREWVALACPVAIEVHSSQSTWCSSTHTTTNPLLGVWQPGMFFLGPVIEKPTNNLYYIVYESKAHLYWIPTY